MLGKYKQALEDSLASIKLDPSYARGYQRAGKAYLTLGRSVEVQKMPSCATSKRRACNAIVITQVVQIKTGDISSIFLAYEDRKFGGGSACFKTMAGEETRAQSSTDLCRRLKCMRQHCKEPRLIKAPKKG